MLAILSVLVLAAPSEDTAAVKMSLSPDASAITFMSWDTEGGDRLQRNLLRSDAPFRAEIRVDESWQEAPAAVRLQYAETNGGFDLTVTPSPASPPESSALRLLLSFDPGVTPTTILPNEFGEGGALLFPVIVSAPDFGQMLVRPVGIDNAASYLTGSREKKTLEWTIEIPWRPENGSAAFEFRAVRLPKPSGLQDGARWDIARRGWFNAFNLTSRWGDQTARFSAPAGILGNNVLSDPASLSVWMYADMILFVPELPGGLRTGPYLRRTLDHWLDNRMQPNGNVIAYWDYDAFLDSLPSLLISAWDYVEATHDAGWLERRIDKLEQIAGYAASRDVDNDGLIEAIPTGNRGSLVQPNRSSCWFDAINFGWKDAYSNALMYRAFCCLADLNARLNREDRREFWLARALRLKQAYAPALLNPETGWLAMWRSQDGELHDYASPIVNGYAIEYGLVDAAQGRSILEKLHAKMKTAGFSNIAFGVPCVLDPIPPGDYLQPAIGAAQEPDGRDTWQEYMNGGITAGQVYHFLAAHYVVGMSEEADGILDAMLKTQHAGGFQNGVQDAYPKGVDWRRWNGDPCGYEGYLADNARFLLAVLTRHADFRERMYRPLHAAARQPAKTDQD
ncbi:MAG TPA: hypothetical protein PKY01_11455 [Candidatus Hydrogenedentes bacterium]|nr:hypothetical protein [Candidatus Hydrogenedentota bacterium]HQH53033.1 hypothetical protein [Candidatus Hydrogenedentota bacterium]HQM48441.1 hypothetical protein [Candidatus Hydrogenedentota bacterium]